MEDKQPGWICWMLVGCFMNQESCICWRISFGAEQTALPFTVYRFTVLLDFGVDTSETMEEFYFGEQLDQVLGNSGNFAFRSFPLDILAMKDLGVGSKVLNFCRWSWWSEDDWEPEPAPPGRTLRRPLWTWPLWTVGWTSLHRGDSRESSTNFPQSQSRTENIFLRRK